MLSESPVFFYLFLLPMGVLAWGVVIWCLAALLWIIRDAYHD